MKKMRNSYIHAMLKEGCSLEDLRDAYPNKTIKEIYGILRDNDHALSRPVIKYGLLGIHAYKSHNFNMHQGGFRENGLEQPWPLEKSRHNIFFMGGSTALGFGISDQDTIPAQLQTYLRSKGMPCDIYNFGSGNYDMRCCLLRFLDIIDQGIIPNTVIFLNGYNECYYAYGHHGLVQTLDYLYQREKKRVSEWRIVSALKCLGARTVLPTSYNYITHDEKWIRDEMTQPQYMQDLLNDEYGERYRQKEELKEKGVKIGTRVYEKYRVSVEMVEQICKLYNIKSYYFWQPVPYFKTSKKHRVLDDLYRFYPYGALSYFVYHWLNMSGNTMGREEKFYDISTVGTDSCDVLYCDVCHYTKRMSSLLAVSIGEIISI